MRMSLAIGNLRRAIDRLLGLASPDLLPIIHVVTSVGSDVREVVVRAAPQTLLAACEHATESALLSLDNCFLLVGDRAKVDGTSWIRVDCALHRTFAYVRARNGGQAESVFKGHDWDGYTLLAGAQDIVLSVVPEQLSRIRPFASKRSIQESITTLRRANLSAAVDVWEESLGITVIDAIDGRVAVAALGEIFRWAAPESAP